MSFIKNFFKNKIVKNLIGAFLFVFVIIVIVSFYLKVYTHHSERIFTPSFNGLTVEQAQKLAAQKDVRVNVIDSVYDAFGEPGTVIEQTPKTNFLIKDGRTIFLTIKAKNKKMIVMPNLNSVSLIQARSEIESAGLKIGRIKYTPSQYNDLVMEQQINGKTIDAGTKVPAGTEIDLVVGQRGGTQASVPVLIGLTLDDANFKAAEYSLNIGNVFYDNSVITARDSAIAVVYKQSLQEGTTVSYGANIDIWLTVK